jgi:6-phosphogluconolactonase (cycloisomerase 2 family)
MSSNHNEVSSLALSRRQFCALVAGSLAVPSVAWASNSADHVVSYASVGPEFRLYRLNERDLSLTHDSSITLPANIQYAWPHPKLHVMYVAYSNRSGSSAGDVHGVTVLRVNERNGRLQKLGEPLSLTNRPISITVDGSGGNLLIAYNDPAQLDIYPIRKDGTLGGKVTQNETIVPGIYAHQVRVAPTGRTALLVTRGNDATATTHQDPGAIKAFDFHDGQLSNEQSIAPGGGYGFGPRHHDFHPTGPWIYVSMERENQLQVFRLEDGKLSGTPVYIRTTLREPGNVRPGQVVGPVHVSRDGNFVYLANRSDGTVLHNGKKVYVGGENSVAVFRIDQQTGEPTLIQTIPTQSFHCRTFAIHPNGKSLITASIGPMSVEAGDTVNNVPAALSVFRIENDGALTFVRKYDVDTQAGPMFWVGLLALQSGWSDNAA